MQQSSSNSGLMSVMLGPMENRSVGDVGGTPADLRIPDGLHHGLHRWIPFGQSSDRRRFLLELLGRKLFRYYPDTHAVWGLLFWRGRSIVGWLLTIAGAFFILAGVIANMHIYFQPISLFHTLVMLVLLVGGLGLIARSVQPHSVRTSS